MFDRSGGRQEWEVLGVHMADAKNCYRRHARPGKRHANVPDMTEEERKRRGDAAFALFHGIVRRANGKEPPQ